MLPVRLRVHLDSTRLAAVVCLLGPAQPAPLHALQVSTKAVVVAHQQELALPAQPRVQLGSTSVAVVARLQARVLLAHRVLVDSTSAAAVHCLAGSALPVSPVLLDSMSRAVLEPCPGLALHAQLDHTAPSLVSSPLLNAPEDTTALALD